MSFTDLAVVSACAAAAYTDMRSHRIPNALPAALCIAGAIAAAREGPLTLLTFVGILALLLLAGTLLHAGGFVGGGDVKLIAAASATFGLHDSVPFLAATLAAGGVLALVIAFMHGRLRRTIVNVGALALPLFAGVRPAPISTTGTKMPYALAILAGAVAVAVLHLTQ